MPGKLTIDFILIIESMLDYYEGLKEAYAANSKLSSTTYQGLGVIDIIEIIMRKKATNKEESNVVDMKLITASVCKFFLMYTRKIEIKIGDQPVTRYYPIRPEGTFFRMQNKEYYLERIEKGNAVQRMKQLMISEMDLSAKYVSNYWIYRFTNFPFFSEITRYERLWTFLCIILSIILNIFIISKYSIIDGEPRKEGFLQAFADSIFNIITYA